MQGVALRYGDAAHRFSPAVEFLGETTMLQSVWRILSAQGLRVQVDLLLPQGTRHADRRALAEHLREQIGAQLHAAPLPWPQAATAAGPTVLQRRHAGLPLNWTPALIDLLLAFDDEPRLAAPLAAALGVPLHWIERHRFPDGESKLRLPAELPPRVALLRGLHRPNDKLAELMIVAPAARELGAAQLTLVCPYLAYMRQDMAFSPGEAVSQRHIGGRWRPGSTR